MNEKRYPCREQLQGACQIWGDQAAPESCHLNLGPSRQLLPVPLDGEGEPKRVPEASQTGAERDKPGLGVLPVFQGNKLPISRNQEEGGGGPGLLSPEGTL